MKSVQEILNLCYDPVNKRLNTDVSVHAADLAAHTFNIGQILRTGEYFFPTPAFTITTFSPVVDTLYAFPLWIPRPLTIDRLAAEVTTAFTDQVYRMGIYNNGTNNYPGTLLLDAGTVAAATTGVKAITISQALARGIYWLALTAALSGGEVRCWGSAYPIMGVNATSLGQPYSIWYVTQAYGALPDPFTAAGSRYFNRNNTVMPRLLSLD